MDDIFRLFDRHAQRSELRSLDRAVRSSLRRVSKRGSRHAEDIAQLQRETSYLALVLGALLEDLHTKGVIDRASLRARIDEVDLRDGVADGRVDTRAAEEAGKAVAGFDTDRQREIVAASEAEPEPPTPIVRRRRRRPS